MKLLIKYLKNDNIYDIIDSIINKGLIMRNNEKRYFLKNANLLAEVNNSKLTYCCYEKEEYSKYDIICKDYKLITPNIILSFFNKNIDRDYIIIRVMTSEHVMPYCKGEKVNLQELKMKPFKHYMIMKEDFEKVYSESMYNMKDIDYLNNRIEVLKEEKKDNKKSIRLNKLEKQKQVPFKERNEQIDTEIGELTDKIKDLADNFSNDIMKYAKEVLRSHWKGNTIETGHFDTSHGHLTNGLVYMIMMLVEQFAKSGNWSGYTYIDDMKGSALVHLCDVSLKFEESESSNVFAYLTQIASNKFTATLNAEKYQRKIKSRMLQAIGYNPTFGEQTNESFKNIYYDDDGNEIEEPDDLTTETQEIDINESDD